MSSHTLRQRSQAHDTVTSYIVVAATKTAARLTESKSHMAEHGTGTQIGLGYKKQLRITALSIALWFVSQVFSTNELV